MDNLRIRILADNKALNGFRTEHGLSMLLDLPAGRSWLWDTGASTLFLEQAEQMDLDPAQWSGAALSHGHWDHTGGLGALLASTFDGPVFAHPGCGKESFRLEPGKPPRPNGLDHDKAPWPPPNFTPVEGEARLDQGLTMLTPIPRLPGNAETTAGAFLDREGAHPDPIAEDACLVADCPSGPVLVLGCCHSGLANTLDNVRNRLGIDRLHGLVGGMHLLKSTEQEWAQAADAIAAMGVQRLHPGHCTGDKAMEYLASRFPGTTVLAAGMVLEFS